MAARLEYEIEVDDDLKDVEIPGMLLQPLVENSIKHGISPLKSGGKISIHCHIIGDKCIISVRDSGKGFEQQGSSDGFGLRGVKERMNLIYGEDGLLEISRNNGTEIRIEVPVIQ